MKIIIKSNYQKNRQKKLENLQKNLKLCINFTRDKDFTEKGIIQNSLGHKRGAIADLIGASEYQFNSQEMLYKRRRIVSLALSYKKQAIPDLNQTIRLSLNRPQTYYAKATVYDLNAATSFDRPNRADN